MLKGLLIQLEERGCALQEAQVIPEIDPAFWHTAIVDNRGFPISGGFGYGKFESRKIAVAEYLERTKFYEIAGGHDMERSAWGLDLIPTACGFAAGFEKNPTVLRSIKEAAERWVMSKWVDDCYYIEELVPESVVETLDPVSRFFFNQFDTVKFFKKSILVNLGRHLFEVEIAQTIGLKGNGIFPGSSAQSTGGTIWQHSLLESFRHLLAYRNNPGPHDSFPSNKVDFFAQNADVALDQIARAHKHDWPIPEVAFHRVEPFLDGKYYVARTILSGWRSWHEGPIERFLY